MPFSWWRHDIGNTLIGSIMCEAFHKLPDASSMPYVERINKWQRREGGGKKEEKKEKTRDDGMGNKA